MWMREGVRAHYALTRDSSARALLALSKIIEVSHRKILVERQLLCGLREYGARRLHALSQPHGARPTGGRLSPANNARRRERTRQSQPNRCAGDDQNFRCRRRFSASWRVIRDGGSTPDHVLAEPKSVEHALAVGFARPAKSRRRRAGKPPWRHRIR